MSTNMSEEIRSLLGSRLKEERERVGLTQDSLGSVAGVSRRAVVEWEKGGTTPSGEALALISQKGIDVLFVLTGQRTPQASASLSQEEAALLDNYQHADDEGRAAARRVLSSLAQQKKVA